MSAIYDNKQRPFSADVGRVTKARLQSSNCPTILKHEVNNNPSESLQPFMNANLSEKQFLLDRPRTASNATKMKFSFLQNMRAAGSPMSGNSGRPLSGAMSSTINFEFLNEIGKTNKGKFQDKSKIKPLKKLNTDQFHSIIYKVKQQKEILEQDINRMEQWHKDFKENDIWNTPQSAIIESIMKQNALSNPEGSVSKYLQTEKEKEDLMRASKRLQRPSSSYSNFAKKNSFTINNAKSVKDFFGAEDDGTEVIEEIIGSKNQFYKMYAKNKREITEKVNNYLENQEKYQSPNNVDNLGGKSISEIVESCEQSESSPQRRPGKDSQFKSKSNHALNQRSDHKNRPFSAKMAVNTVFAPKDFANGLTIEAFSPPGMMPSAIHTRPQTAKQARPMTSATITGGLAASGEQRLGSVSNVRFIPMMMSGQKIPVEPYNSLVNKTRDFGISGKGVQFGMHEMRPQTSHEFGYGISRSTKNIPMSPNSYFGLSPQSLGEHEGNRGFQRRAMSGKINMKTTAGTQTQTHNPFPEGSASIGKLNIDGEYFQSFNETFKGGFSKTTISMAGDKKKISTMDSWTKDARPYSRPGQERDLL